MAGNDIANLGLLRALHRICSASMVTRDWNRCLSGEDVRRERTYRLRMERELPEGCNDVGR
jgi:hypothetical protein